MTYTTVNYTKEMGENPLTEEMRKVLSKLSLDEQINYFVIEEETNRSESDYDESSDWTETESYPLATQLKRSDFDAKVEKIIVYNGIIVGVFFYRRPNPILLNKWVCTYCDSEEDGPWSSSISVCKRIVFVNKQA